MHDDARHHEMANLVAAMLDDELSADDQDRLSRWLAEHPDARRRYCEQIGIHTMLHWSQRQVPSALVPSNSTPMPGELTASQEFVPQPGGNLPQPFRARVAARTGATVALAMRFVSRPHVFSSAVALLFLSTTIVVMALVYLRKDPPGEAPTASPRIDDRATAMVGFIGRATDVRWLPPGTLRSRGTAIHEGDRLQIEEGNVELMLQSGVTVLLAAPADFVVHRADATELKSGALTALVPPGAKGFSVDTPATSVVDLGTEFGILVDEHRSSLVTVFQGSVDVRRGVFDGTASSAPDYWHRQLKAGESLRVHLEGSVDAADPADNPFVRQDQFAQMFVGSPVEANLALWLDADHHVQRDADGAIARWESRAATAVPEAAVPDDAAPDDAAPDDVAPDDAAPDDMAPDDVAPEAAPPTEALFAYQEAPRRRPLWIENGTGNHAVVQFDGVNDFLRLPAPSQMGMLRSDYEVFLVAMSNVPNIQFLLGGAVTHYELHLNHPDDRVGLRYIPVAPYRLSRSFDIGRQGQFSDGRFHIFSARVEKAPGFRGASSVDSRGAGDETIADARSDSDAPLLIGRRADMSFPLKGQVAEVLIYRSALSPPMRSQVLTYLIRKYRLTVR